MLDRYRPRQSTDQEDAARTAWLAAEHDRARDRFLARERRKRGVAIALLCSVLGGVGYFVFHQWQSSAALHPLPASTTSKAAPGKDLVNQSAVREAVFRALQSRGVAGKQGERAILSEGHQRQELDLRSREQRRESAPK